MAKRMNIELPDDVADFVDRTYIGKSPQATIKQILKDLMNNKTSQGVNQDDRTTK
ncbi:hypothetical protein MK852_23785 [Shewanella benthica]|uniref:hypothetical protein n=1 Tax=Shewanella benthica TaxID=43661 RepID=UPI00187902CE|nr:hypothetical protein [Shewanella benthica]MBE7216382.1 hypothetical protein [Shewanella benthica]MCL1065116.1 hypothetical protein [Shewanella benthica]